MPEEKSIKLVLDTNVLISAFLYRKKLGIIADLVNAGSIIPCFTKMTLLELKETVSDKKFHSVFIQQKLSPEELIEFISRKSIILADPTKIPTIIAVDPADNHILSCALISNADFIVSGDRHLLKLKHFQGIPILTPQQFLTCFKKQRR